jgi:hypothetical protein
MGIGPGWRDPGIALQDRRLAAEAMAGDREHALIGHQRSIDE